MKKIILLPLIAASLSACTTLNKSTVSANINASIQTNLKADIKVDMNKKLKGQAANAVLFGFQISGPDKFSDSVFGAGGGFLNFGSASDDLKAAAAYNALKAGGAEVMIAPQYIIEKKNYYIYSTTTVQVTGFAGTINKIE